MENINKFNCNNITWREEPVSTDIRDIVEIVSSTGFFNDEELDVAAELVEERLTKGTASGYYFLFMEVDNKVTGYSCFGPIPGTMSSFDLYWIAVHNASRGMGFGKIIMERSEKEIARMKGNRIYVETSSKELYIPTRKFYEACGYIAEARLKDFYAPGDDKIIYVKKANEPIVL
ncbi:MAG: GNAT family N-acetyltransferase [Deltaproteobacteria bacterium]|nr:GNAT family N-acetyltransferase [Deltaproteobacteria bacterium]